MQFMGFFYILTPIKKSYVDLVGVIKKKAAQEGAAFFSAALFDPGVRYLRGALSPLHYCEDRRSSSVTGLREILRGPPAPSNFVATESAISLSSSGTFSKTIPCVIQKMYETETSAVGPLLS